MPKRRYVNFARKKNFKGHRVKDNEESDLNHGSSSSKATGKPRKARNVLKMSIKQEEVEIAALTAQYEQVTDSQLVGFSDYPLSKKTKQGLQEAGFVKPTAIQRHSILSALRGKDVLAAAKTGSGKTLAFLIPVIELLYRNKWTRMDGLGALIITPTRELALQIFETFGKVCKHHDFTTGLIIGGQNLKYERNRLHNLNIMICTPGRLLQHMDQNPLFDSTNVKVLVLDEADRCLDMGFAATMNAIISNLPSARQTLLFSATQTKSVEDLARLNLSGPEYIAPHEKEQFRTPDNLRQVYVLVQLEQKLEMLWSFLRSHPKQKIIVFFATCKQVKYYYQVFKKLRPAMLLLPLHGGMNQEKRNEIYDQFCRKSNVCLLATDVASRGLDFPRITWVVQIDCPEDVVQYIHRVGRAARLNNSGESVLLLLPHEEEAMVEAFKKNHVPIERIELSEKSLVSPLVKIQSLLAQSPELKDCAKRAFVAYIKSVALMKNKLVFNCDHLNLDAYAKSLGLNVTPKVRLLSKMAGKRETVSKVSLVNDSDSEDDMLTVKQRNHDIEGVAEVEAPLVEEPATAEPSKKRVSKAKMARKSLVVGKKTVFDDGGSPVEEDGAQPTQTYSIEEARYKLQQQDAADKKRYRSLKQTKRQEQREKLKRKAEPSEMDEFDSESEASVNLDWLPDPDKIYGNKAESPPPKKAKKKQIDVRKLALSDVEKIFTEGL